MEKYFANYNQSLALKELGFDEPCFGYRDGGGYLMIKIVSDEGSNRFLVKLFNLFRKNENQTYNQDYVEYLTGICTAPLKSQVFEWFRKQGYDTKIHKEYAKVYLGFYWTGAAWEIVGNGSYEEAESACIDKLIEIVQNNLDK